MRRTRVLYDGQFELRGYDSLPASARAGEAIEIGTYWARRAPADYLYLTHFWLIDEHDRELLYRTRYVGYALFTPAAWPQDVTVREIYRLVAPKTLPPGRYRVALRVAHRRFAEPRGSLAVPDRPELQDPRHLLQIGSLEIR